MLTDLTDDISKELDELLVKKEKYNDDETEKKIELDKNKTDKKEEKKEELNDDLLEFIDSTLYKNGDE